MLSRYFGEASSVILLSLFINVLSEVMLYFLVYRKPEYAKAKNDLSRMEKELKKQESTVVNAKDQKKHEKTLAKLKEEEKNLKSSMAGMTTTKNLYVVMFTFMMAGVFRSYYDGVIVAKLPFESPKLFRYMTHGTLKGTDFTDCAMTGLYFLCNMAFRQTIKMLLGQQSPRSSAGLFPSMDEMEEKVNKMYK